MNPIKKATVKTVSFVANHKVAIAVTATAVTTAVVVRNVYKHQLDLATDFIADEGLLEKFKNLNPIDLDN